ncbi:MAG TPA: AzlD domain-containing protein [Patescibacteria group bacterium]|nr:AzlD domain-containing protein [Patescibacteria group bacterium]
MSPISVELVGLAVLMFAVTYPPRAIPLLLPRFEHLPPRAREYLRLVGPAALGAIAAAEVLLRTGPDGRPTLSVGWEALAVLACAAVVAWRRNLALGLLVAVALIAGLRALGVA